MVIAEKAHAECVRLLELLTNKRVQESWSWVFMTPVTGIANYADIIKKPMDLGTVKKNLGSKPSRCRFKSHEKFAKDVRLVFQNALIYNKDDEQVKGSVYDAAQHLLRVFETAYTKAKETGVFGDEEDAGDHNSSTNEEQEAGSGGGGGAGGGGGGGADSAEKEKEPRRSSSHSHSHSHGHGEAEGGASSFSSKHKKEKKEKKEKKSKKSKKKSKDKDKEGHEKDKERSKDKDKDKEKKKSSSSSSTSASADKSHNSSSRSSSSRDATVAAGSSATVPHIAPAGEVSKTEKPKSSASTVAAAPVASTAAPTTAVVAAPAASAATNGSKMSDETMAACLSVLMKLIKYKEANVSPAAPFLQPVDLTHFPDYKVKVPHRMHLYGVQKKLRSGGYASIDAFAHDVRLIFSNCLVYNSDVVLSKVIRSHAVTLMKLFETQFAKIGGSWPGIADRWKCHQIIHEILANRTDGNETAQWFKYPIETYFDSAEQVPYGYFKKIKHPMDLGSVSAKLHLGVYKQVPELLQDLKLIFDNCLRYWTGDPHGESYCESAKKLIDVLKTQASAVFSSSVVDKAMSKEKSSSKSSSSSSSASVAAAPSVAVAASSSSSSSRERKSSSASATSAPSSSAAASSSSSAVEGEKSRKRSAKHITSNFPEKEVCMDILKSLRLHKMKGYRGMEIPTAGPFLHAVDVAKYPDYLKIVSEPMDFAKIERKLKGDRYSDVNEFSADVHLIFSNCHKYNSDPVEGADIRAMASNLRDYFVDLYNGKFGTGEVKTDHANAPLVSLPSAKLEVAASRSETSSSSKKLLSPKAVKKAPSSSPPAQPLAAPAIAPPVAKLPSTTAAKSSESSVKVSSSSTSAQPSIKTESSTGVATTASSGSSSTTPAKSSTSSMTPQELEEYKKLKKEKKEKKEKKKKDKKEKKKKDKDKKEKKKDKEKDKDKVKTSRSDASVPPVPSSSASTSVPAFSAASAPPAPHTASSTSTAIASQSHAKTAVPVVPPPARASQVASKISPAEASSGSAKSKTKKSKKSDLTGWEASAERVLNRLVKIEQVTKLHFDQPLLEVFPQLAADYSRLVQEPMDLRTLREKLHAHSMTPAEFTRLGKLIFQNAIKFNCAPDLASQHVRDMSAHLLWYFESLCAEQKLIEAPGASAKLEEMRRERAAQVSALPMEVKAKECQKLLRVLNSQKYDKNCWPFRKSVQVLFPTLPPEYYEIIKTPMDLAAIADKLAAFEYKLHGDFISDVRLTFQNALKYNHADKDREGWNVYAAAVQMLAVVEEQWCDVTLEVMERVRRRDIVRKERERLGEKRKGDKSEKRSHDGERKLHVAKASNGGGEERVSSSAAASVSRTEDAGSTIAKAITVVPSASKEDGESSTKFKLSLVNRQNLDRMNKSERKAEEKRRKRARREEEIARSEKRRRTAVAATDDALREAELRSRRRLQKQEIAEAVKQREARERQAREDEAARALAVKMKFNAAAWTGQVKASLGGGGSSSSSAGTGSQGFWIRKKTKLEVPAPFRTAIDSC